MKKTPKNFEEAISRLEALTQIMQNPDTPLEDALKNYEEGRALVAFCREKLAQVEQKLQILDNEHLTELNLDPS
ncbi:MAG: exodeoxyribonuclease VII small subunit [Neisseria sp.]|nr:exodeoxyribonuclease VII small subunit [Neisseria sp.]